MTTAQDPSPIRAPELTGAIAWLNVPAPLAVKALRGKVVLLDFWTYGCINCIHILPDLKKLEAKFPDELVVIGVHAAKFDNEQGDREHPADRRRYEIAHPVANDAEFRIWRAYTVRAWPSRVIIDPAGYIVGAASGEGNYEGFEQAIAAVIEVFDERGELDRPPSGRRSPRATAWPTPPLQVSGQGAGRADERLFISDSNHHQIVVADARRPQCSIASAPDGPGRRRRLRRRPSFDRPQGLALGARARSGSPTPTTTCCVRWTSTRARVSTVAGTGEQCMWQENRRGGAQRSRSTRRGTCCATAPLAVRRHGRSRTRSG